MLRTLKNALNLRAHFLRVCAHCFPKDQLFNELRILIDAQRRTVINHDDAVIIAKANAAREKLRLANFERHYSRIRPDMAT